MSISLGKTNFSEDIVVGGQSKRFYEHYRFPYHLGLLTNFHGKATGTGSCGDKITISLRFDGNTIIAIGQEPHGCAFTIASASAISVLAMGKAVDDALQITPEDVEKELGGLPEGHHHCARLAVNTLGEAIESAYQNITHVNPHEE
jgi:nitrogen fixation NifU-like protein